MLDFKLSEELKKSPGVLFEYRYVLKIDGKLQVAFVTAPWSEHEKLRVEYATNDDLKIESALRDFICIKLLDESFNTETVKAPCNPENEKHEKILEVVEK